VSGGLLPNLPAASSVAPEIDLLFVALLALSTLVVLGVAGTIMVFAIRYRRGSSADRGGASEDRRIEYLWSGIPLLLFLTIFAWAARIYYDLSAAPDDAVPVYVVGKQWMWKLEHRDGRREINTLHIPVERPVKLIMSSQDVIHSFYVPAFRIKQDVVPGRYTTLWFEATEPGTFRLMCAEYCGTDHAKMRGSIIAMRPAEYERWLAGGTPPGSMAEQGGRLFRQFGCSGCHSPHATVHAPDLHGLFGRPVQLADGTSVIADEAYIRDSILLPRKQVVAGFAPIMPTFEGQIGESEILRIIAYIKSLGTEEVRRQ
jgi:cytochrome c oxidase subunit 2